ncbi:hypothetical protein NDU88_001487 [Pleurodeles waltl]|uniref:CCHC-type domain-containing protein n=1 Tax=Pleurodeles waltl TaxID=8319 RepID=A0AAV7Q390_PLEWA|nr:hypothetical protein NDU88_001487 [Pleurodeles waltl]
MIQDTTRGAFVGSSQGTTPVEPTFEGSRSLLDFSLIGAPPETMRKTGSRLLTPQISSANVPQTPLVQDGNILLQGLTAQQLTDWLDKLNTPQTAPVAAGRAEGEEYLNHMRLGMEANELVEGSMGVNRLESYTEAELRVSPKNIDWQRIDRTAQEVKKSIHAYYERLLKAFKHYSGSEVIEAKDMNHLVFRFVEGLRPEIGQMIKNHLICWQAKPIDEVLQYCSDEIKMRQRKLKEKAMMMQIKAAQTVMQGGFLQQMVHQPQGNRMFQVQVRGRGRGGFVKRSPDLNTVVVQNNAQGMKKMLPCHACGVVGHWKRECPMMVQDGATRSTVRSAEVPKLPLLGQTVKVVGVANQLLTNPITDPVQVELGTFQGLHRSVVCDSSPVSLLGRDLLCKTRCSITCSNEGIEGQTNSDDEGEEQGSETETTDEEYSLINFFPMFTVADLPVDLQGTVQEKVWDLTGKEVGLIKGVEPVKVNVKPNSAFLQIPQYHMAQDILIKVAQIIADFVKQEVLKEVLSSPCNSPIMGLRKPCGKILIVQDLRKIND